MSWSRWSSTVGTLGGALLVAPMMVDCRPREPHGTAPPPSCESDESSPEGLTGISWQALLEADARVGTQLRRGSQVAVSLKRLATSLDGQLRDACNGLARDLGGSEGKDAHTACQSASDAVRRTRLANGPRATYSLGLAPPRCTSRMDEMAACTSACDAQAAGRPSDAQAAGRAVEVRCEGGEITGECGDRCTGACDLSVGGRCEGTCSGKCDGEINGVCDGKCDGKCEPDRDSWCHGRCEGRCDNEMKGTCLGTCKGACQLGTGGSCPGLCGGTCSSVMKAPRCSGKLSPQEVAVACATSCDAQALARITCSAARVALRIDGSSDAAAAARFKAASEKHLGAIVAISVAMKGRLDDVADRGQAILTSTREASTGGGTPDQNRAARCIQASLPAAFDAVVSLRANVRVAADLASQVSAAR